jgi:hypothetical protein
VLWLGVLGVGTGWAMSTWISLLRVKRFDVDPGVAYAAKKMFAEWHPISLMLSMLTLGLAGIALLMAANMPERGSTPPDLPPLDGHQAAL